MNVVRSAVVAISAGLAALGMAACSNSDADTTEPSVAALTGLSSQVPEKVRQDGKLTVGIDPNYPPMEYLERGSAVGADVDIMRGVAQKLGLELDLLEDTYALLVPGVAANRFEAAISALTVDQTDRANADMVTYYRAGSQLGVRPPAKDKFGPTNLCGRKVAVLDGTVQSAQLAEKSANCIERGRKPIQIMPYQSQEPATRAVIGGKVYATLADSPVITHAAKVNDGRFVPNGRAFAKAPYGIAVSKDRRAMARLVRKAVQSMIDDGSYQRILEKWGIEDGAIRKSRVLS